MPHSNRYLVLVEVLGTLAAVVLLNFLILAYLKDYTPNFGYWTLNQKWELLLEHDEEVDWLILGDSSCNQGVMPAVFESELGQSALNLCTIGNVGTLGDLWMLDAYIERFGPPQHVVIVHVYDIWYRKINPVIFGQVQVPPSFWQNFLLADEFLGDDRVKGELFIERYVPLHAQGRIVGQIFQEIFLLERNPLLPKWSLTEDGYLPADPAMPDIVVNGAESHIQFVMENSFSVSEVNQKALRAIIDLAEEYQFDVILVNSPVYEGLYANADFQVYLANMMVWQQRIATKSERIQVISNVRTFPADQMQNPDHLITSGAVAYTDWLLEEIKAR
ncbi:MAG: hypothetical protein JW726_12345 [Anaerolineales bacterium]|nr:hypothetical protein [Anaerolineales bacterium]